MHYFQPGRFLVCPLKLPATRCFIPNRNHSAILATLQIKAIEKMIGCEGIKGKKNFALYGSIGLVQEIKTWKVTPGIQIRNTNTNTLLAQTHQQ